MTMFYARRNKEKGTRPVRRFTSHTYYRTLQHMTRIPIQVDTGDFRLFSRRCVMALRQFREASRQNKALFSWIGYRKKEITYDQPLAPPVKLSGNLVYYPQAIHW